MNCQTIDGYVNIIKLPIPFPERISNRKSKPDRRSWEKYFTRQRSIIYEYEHNKLAINETEKTFKELASKWRRETRALSMMIHKTILNPTYRKIIDLGEPIVPYILKDLMNKPDHWFIALEEIYREQQINPVAKKDMGNIKKMAEAWIDWGRVNEKI